MRYCNDASKCHSCGGMGKTQKTVDCYDENGVSVFLALVLCTMCQGSGLSGYSEEESSEEVIIQM